MQALTTTASPCAASQPQQRVSRRGICSAQARPSSQAQRQDADTMAASRRGALLSLVSVAGASVLSGAAPQLALAASPVPVGTYLPAAEGMPGFCLYSPDGKKTPAIRAGVIKPEPAYYQLALPSSWAELPLLNPLTGNFCMPRCEEPWYEFKFEDPKEGTVQLIVAENQKLGAKPGATLAQFGTPEAVVNRVGNFITGTYLDEEDVLSAESKQLADGRTYYVYENGLAYLLTVSASEKQWGSSQDKLRTMVESFQA
ncbi:PsbP domain-containing protein 6 [Chlorella vulgaris]